MAIIKVWHARKQQKITLVKLAEMTGISKSTLNNIENGKTSPTIYQLETIAKALKISVCDLVELSNNVEN